MTPVTPHAAQAGPTTVPSGTTAASVQADTAHAAPGAVSLSDAQRLLTLFTQGLSGRYLHLRPTDALTGQFRPEVATTDGMAIYLPAEVALFDTSAHNLGLYKIAVLHQLGLYECGTFTFSMRQARARIPDLPADRPGAAEHPSELERFFNLWRRPTLMRRLFMTLEDLRIDAAMTRRYPGARHDLERVLARARADRPTPPEAHLQPAAALLESLVRFTLGEDASTLLAHDATGWLAPMLEAAALLTLPHASVYDTAHAAAVCLRTLASAVRAEPHETEDAETTPAAPGPELRAQGTGGLEGSPDEFIDDTEWLTDDLVDGMPVDFRGEVRPELVQRQLRGGHTGTLLEATETEPGAMQDDDELQGTDLIRRDLSDQSMLRRAFGEVGRDARSFLYDEWDYTRQTYMKGWCRLFEMRLAGDDYGLPQRVRERHGALVQQIKRQFRMIKPEAYHRVRRVSDGEEIELDGVIEAAVDRRAGHATDEHVYRRRARALREVSAAFLLDMSASTDFAVPDPLDPPPPEPSEPPPLLADTTFDYAFYNDREPPPARSKRRVIDVGRESLALMAQALETLGDSYALYGFSGYGHDNVEFHVAKDFGEALSPRAWAAMAAMQPRSSTRMGTAIRHALTRLAAQPARMKVLIVVSDGYPQDRDYGPDPRDDEYGIQDTARALMEAERAGVQTFCMTIDPAGHDYLRRMCPDARYMVIDEVNDLPRELTKVYRALTA